MRRRMQRPILRAEVLAALALALGCGYDGPRVTVQELKGRLDRPDPRITIVDVRPRALYTKGHVAGAVNCPLEQLAACRPEIAALDGDVAVICNCGRGALAAIKQLAAHGVSAILVEGGYKQWRAAGFALVKD
jgi:phage shock protein E